MSTSTEIGDDAILPWTDGVTPGLWTVDVAVCRHFPVHPRGEFWVRVHLLAADAVEAELTACLWAGRRGHPVASIVADWP